MNKLFIFFISILGFIMISCDNDSIRKIDVNGEIIHNVKVNNETVFDDSVSLFVDFYVDNYNDELEWTLEANRGDGCQITKMSYTLYYGRPSSGNVISSYVVNSNHIDYTRRATFATEIGLRIYFNDSSHYSDFYFELKQHSTPSSEYDWWDYNGYVSCYEN